MYTYMYIYMHVHVRTYTYMYTYMYIYIHTSTILTTANLSRLSPNSFFTRRKRLITALQGPHHAE